MTRWCLQPKFRTKRWHLVNAFVSQKALANILVPKYNLVYYPSHQVKKGLFAKINFVWGISIRFSLLHDSFDEIHSLCGVIRLLSLSQLNFCKHGDGANQSWEHVIACFTKCPILGHGADLMSLDSQQHTHEPFQCFLPDNLLKDGQSATPSSPIVVCRCLLIATRNWDNRCFNKILQEKCGGWGRTTSPISSQSITSLSGYQLQN